MANTNLNNLKSINSLFNHNKSNMESLIKEAEQITGCNLRSRAQSERTYFAYDRTYLEPEEIEQARNNNELPGQCNNTNIKVAETKKFTSYYTEVKTNRPGYIDAHIENTYESGEKYYHLMTADKDQTFFITKFYDKPITTLCFTDTDILYIPSEDWTKVTKKSYENLLKEMGDKSATKWGMYNESVYIAINRNIKFDTNGIAISPFKSVRQNLSGEIQNKSEYYIGRPCFRGYTGASSSYKGGETANKTLLCISPLMGEEALSENKYTAILYATRNRVCTERTILEELLKNPVDGILVEGTKSAMPNPNFDLYMQLIGMGIPIVFFNGYYPSLSGTYYVCADNKSGGAELVRHLISRGHTKIAGYFKSDDIQGHQRYSGFLTELFRNGLIIPDENVFWYTTETKGTLFDDPQEVLKRLGDNTAVVCYNDEIAFGLVKCLLSAGKRIPEDIAVVSFDNSNLSRISQVPITSLSYEDRNIGRIAAHKLMDILDGKEVSSEVVPWTFIRKESS